MCLDTNHSEPTESGALQGSELLLTDVEIQQGGNHGYFR